MAEAAFDPGFVVMQYVVSGRIHRAKYQVKFVGVPVPGVEPELQRRDGTSNTLTSAMASWVAVIRTAFNTAVDFQFAEAWYQPTPTADPLYIYTATIALTGSSATATGVSRQLTLTNRTAGGSILKIVLLEGAFTLTDSVDTFPYAPGGISANIMTYLLGATCVIRGKDDTLVVAGIKALLKTNDALRKRQFNL